MSEALVTGGAGFIGSHLVDRLVVEGRSVAVVDDLSRGSRANLAEAEATGRVRLHVADVTAPGFADLVAAERPRVIVHLAAQIDVSRSIAAPVEDALANVVGTIRVLEAAVRAGVDKVLFATSGGAIYGEPTLQDLPLSEHAPGHAASPYGAGKRAAEEYLRTYGSLHGLRWTSLALANVYGPRQVAAGEGGVVGVFAERMLRGEPVTIFGDGEQTRDFVYVGDVVDALLAAFDAGDGLRINIGTGRRVSVNELWRRLAAIIGVGAEPLRAPARPGELLHSALDTGLAERALGWRPRTGIDEGLVATVAAMRG